MKKLNTRGNFLAEYIKDIVYGANDGIITTFTVIAGVIGASLSYRIILILGFANLIADAISMAASNYLGSRSEIELIKKESGNTDEKEKKIVWSAVSTFWAFVAAGSLPLLPFVVFADGGTLLISTSATALTLFIVGAARSFITELHWFISGLEMLVIGGIAAAAAYFIGYALSSII